VIEPCHLTFQTIDVTHPGVSNHDIAFTNWTKFSCTGVNVSLPRHHLTTLRAFPANLGLSKNCSSRKASGEHPEYVAHTAQTVHYHQLIYRAGISTTIW